MLIEVPRDDWDVTLTRLGITDAYFLEGYLAAAQELEESERRLLCLEESGGAVVFAFLLRSIPGGVGADIVTPYGYGGPVAVGDSPPTAAFHRAFSDWCRETGVVSSFIRYHPLLLNHTYAHPNAVLEQGVGTAQIQLSPGRDLLAAMHGKHRNVTRKAMAQGLEVSVRRAPTTLDSFRSLYMQTMDRVGATGFYRFSPSYWEALEREMASDIVLCEASRDGELLACSMLLVSHPNVHYHLSATRDDARQLGASNLVLWHGAVWAQERGFRVLHLGGGVGGREDSLLQFKRRFDVDAELLPSVTGKIVHDLDGYRELSGHSEVGAFFPAYRRPLSG